jgi:hypothetical protein
VDRLDTWLNAQRGRRRLWLVCLNAYPAAVCIAVIVMGSQNLTGRQPPGIALIFWSLALAVPGALPLGGLILLTRQRYERRARARGKFEPPFFLWRMTGYIFLLATAITIQQFGIAQPPGWQHERHVLDLISLVFLACAMILLLDGLRYTHRLRRLARGRLPTSS